MYNNLIIHFHGISSALSKCVMFMHISILNFDDHPSPMSLKSYLLACLFDIHMQ